ncbi:hypothetical protein ACOSQ3_012475 [Xanthoceras sorbifolium]
MELISRNCRISVVALVVLLSCFFLDFGNATDTITSLQFIRDPETIVSSAGTFKMGFFSPGNSTNRYVGVWYTDVSPTTVVWVANCNKPLNDSSGVLTISEDGNLVVLNGQKEVLWSSNVSNSATNSTFAQLLDSGNLVLSDKTKEISIWESFLYPTDTSLPGMRLSTNLRTGDKLQLTSWKSPSDPSTGRFSTGIDPLNIPEIFIWKDNRPYWRTGPWNGRIFLGMRNVFSTVYLDGFNLVVDNQEDIAYFDFGNSSRFYVMTSDGILQERDPVLGTEFPEIFWAPKIECDIYGTCGPFGICNSITNPICSCLRGFEPKNEEEWNMKNWTSGCVRRRPLQCESINKTGEVGKEDGFLKLETTKLPDFAERSTTPVDKCREQCLNNCSCMAYTFDVGIGCMTWSSNLTDLQKFPKGGADLYIRLANPELAKKDTAKIIIIATVIPGMIIVAISTYFCWRWIGKRKAMKINNMVLGLDKGESSAEYSDLPLFSFKNLATATNNFHLSNKLGQGGFGPVYRGVLEDGQEIAVKRLSKTSGQGLEEFMNEVMVISKLQHRNLVRLLGCCVAGEEKLLIYEYLPNKSLDAFLFDPQKQQLLDWSKRFKIIEGISRGLLYLHRDSRLRIIHRDLKASNILLDEELNPKISDFGMARIFGGDQSQANTARVVGTYGYMSPEYAMVGRFSEKSDVFSFGVLLLEIVTNRRNTSFNNDEHCSTLLDCAWKLWKENKIINFIDSLISDPCSRLEMLRCIHVGLLCVQEYVKDRPTMSTIVSMLNNDIVDLPAPDQPAFTAKQNALVTESPQHGQSSTNNVTLTVIHGR